MNDPPFLIDIEGLDSIPWNEYDHAYGPASDVPRDIRGLVSSDPEIREEAAWNLSGSIYHQGTLYPATTIAVPFLVGIASNDQLPDRVPLMQLLDAIAESTSIDPDSIRKNWRILQKHLGESFRKPTVDMAEDQITTNMEARKAMLTHHASFLSLATDPDAAIAKLAASIVNHLDIRNH
ncbi:MAG: hypothetical protein ACRC8S_18905 [Fimbriiglobus sp.]